MAPPRRLGLWLLPIALMGAIFLLSAQSSLDTDLGLLDTIGRKLVHFAQYALLCLLWWRPLSHGRSPRHAILIAFLISSAYAATDEYHQSFVEGRHGTPVDWAIDSAGAAAAALWLRTRRRAPA